MIRFKLAAILLVSLFQTNIAFPALYSFAEYNFVGSNGTNFSDINNLGVIAGHYGVTASPRTLYTAFTFDRNTYSTFSVPGAWGTFSRGINDLGVVVGEYGSDLGNGAFRYDGTTLSTFNAPGAVNTNFNDINNDGIITGNYSVNTPDGLRWIGFTFDGISYTNFSVPGATNTFTRGINSSGHVVGTFTRSLGSGAYIYDGNTFSTFMFQDQSTNGTNFTDINDSGLVSGYYGAGSNGSRPFVAFTFDGMDYSTFEYPGAWGTFTRGMNNNGFIVGEIGRDSGNAAFVAIPIPEPFHYTTLLAIFVLIFLKYKKSGIHLSLNRS